MNPTTSIILTVHNKEIILDNVLDRLSRLTSGNHEVVVVLDGCTDKSEAIVMTWLRKNAGKGKSIKVVYTNDVFEIKANNAGIKKATGEYIILVQDDMLLNEEGWNIRLTKPFKQFNDLFAVSARTAHNWMFNSASQDVYPNDLPKERWSDLLIHCDHINIDTTSDRDVLYIRDSCNRGPLAIRHDDLIKLNYLDETYFLQEFDDHDLMFRAKKYLGKVCGFYLVNWFSKPEYGGTRDSKGRTKQWLFEAHHKNAALFYARHNLNFEMTKEQRVCK